jgi:DNA invertase Pin-like site-specific DNA recombinase
MLVGYMRVSSDTDRQTTDLQRDALLAAGVDNTFAKNQPAFA